MASYSKSDISLCNSSLLFSRFSIGFVQYDWLVFCPQMNSNACAGYVRVYLYLQHLYNSY